MTGVLIREARKRAGLTQRELAERAQTSQSAIARYERGASEPTLPSLERLLAACGLDLHVELWKHDDHDLGLAISHLRRTPEQRLDDLVAMQDFADEARRAMRVTRKGA